MSVFPESKTFYIQQIGVFQQNYESRDSTATLLLTRVGSTYCGDQSHEGEATS